MSILGEVREIAELVKKVGDMELYGKIVALQSSVVELSGKNVTLHEANLELRAQLKKADDWIATKSRYKLVSPWQGPAQVYALLQTESLGEQPHLLCTNCFEQSRTAILNPMPGLGVVVMGCASCDLKISTGYNGIGAPEYAERYLERMPT